MLRRDSRQRAAVASALRADHRSWREVARALGYRSVGAAQAAVKAHLDPGYRQPHEQTVWEQIEAVRLVSDGPADGSGREGNCGWTMLSGHSG